MNLKTTLALLVVLGCGVGLYFTGLALPPALAPLIDEQTESAADAGSLAVLAGMKPAELKRVQVQAGKERTVLSRAADGAWVMPGNWPTRAAEVQQLIDLVGNLHSRFHPTPLEGEEDLATFGLDAPAVTVVVQTADGEHRLSFAEAAPGEESSRFDRPTYLRVDDLMEVLQLGPGVVAQLDRPADYYQQRRLFPVERVPREEGSTARVERLAGKRLEVREGGKLKYALVKGPGGWELAAPYRDALDPAASNALLEALPDVWAERFLPADRAKSLDELGLKNPDRVVSVTRADGGTVTLEVGKPSLDATPANRAYARLRGFDRVFEINPDKLTPVYVALDALRDNQLARFKAEDAREIEIATARGKIVLRNTAPPRKPGETAPAKGEWKLVVPAQSNADSALVDRLVSTLANLSAVDKDVAQKVRTAQAASTAALPALAGGHASLLSGWLLDPKRLAETYGLAKPAATVKVVVEERPAEGKPATKRTVTVALGRHDRLTKKLYARSQDWPRINEVDDALADLVLDKTALDYRGRRLLDFLSFDVDRIEVFRPRMAALAPGLLGLGASLPGYSRLGQIGASWAEMVRKSEYLALKRTASGWALTAPVKTEADAGKVNDLADRLGKLEALAFVADSAPAKEMQARFGLGLPELIVTVAFTDPKKPPQTLHVGEMRPLAAGRFARLEGAPEVFAIPSELVGQLARDSLAYRPASLWQLAGDEIARLRIQKAGQADYELVRKGDDWQVVGPFTVSAPREVVDRLTTALAAPRAEEYRAHAVSDFAPFGLASPPLKVTITTKGGKQHALWIAAETKSGAHGKLARMAGGAALFVVSDALAKAVDQSALDFLDRNILKIDSGSIVSFVRKQGPDVLELVKKDDGWQMVKPAAGPADEKKVPELLKELGELKAERIAAYKPKNLAEFGLAEPEATVAIKTGGDGKVVEYVLELGKEPPAGEGRRYARVKGGPTVAVLPAAVVKKLLAGPLAYRDHAVARLTDADTIKLEAGERRLTFARPEGSWKLTQPLSADADHDALEAFVQSLSRLRADELIAEKPTAEQWKSFGLEKPVARWQFLTGERVELDLAIGATEKGGVRRYACLGGKDLVFLLDAKLSGQVLAEYRPRVVFKDNIDPAQVEAVRFGYAKDPFELKKVDGTWEVVGKPDVKVNAAAVSDALSALRDLKLERYVKDAGAQLKLFGLGPPDLVLTVTTPTGKHTLHVGGLEGTSKRRYARLPMKDRADVFVLDEAASGKLVRDLAGLMKEGK